MAASFFVNRISGVWYRIRSERRSSMQTFIGLLIPFLGKMCIRDRGTYIRTICQDAGDFLGCGGTLKSLVRTRSGIFDLSLIHI